MTTSVPAPRAPAVVAAVGGCAALLLRPVLLADLSHPALVLAVLFGALAVVGLTWPFSPHPSRLLAGEFRQVELSGQKSWRLVLVVGVAAFTVGRFVAGGHPPTDEIGVAVLGNTLAAVAEEAFFRRFLYGVLAPYGAGVAIGVTAVAFAAVHVTVYGAWVLPIDLAAGALLSWQRWATGSWTVPAATHVIANLLVVM
ncbi:MAG TPA: CPBP family intramembrane glutamic endopeptidase [Acidimicrobiales bacterium]|nr:CPBP family intramembrane glutamic endopeptidase [Acidimicrobiales bacterium]